jgi:hypothetical protein
VFKLALDTQRAASFHFPETFAEILRAKLPHLAGKWARKEARDESYLDGVPSGDGLTFPQFLSFLRENNRVSEVTSTIMKVKAVAPTKSLGQKGSPSVNTTSATVPKEAEKEKENGGGAKISNPGPVPFHSTTNSSKGGPRWTNSCPSCSQTHSLDKCSHFYVKAVPERWKFCKGNQLCFKCLKPNHMIGQCQSGIQCAMCQRDHHTLLHEDRGSPSDPNNTNL